MNDVQPVNQPLNQNEQYMHGINVRLEVLIDQFSSLLEHIASTKSVAIEENQVETTTRTTRKRNTTT